MGATCSSCPLRQLTEEFWQSSIRADTTPVDISFELSGTSDDLEAHLNDFHELRARLHDFPDGNTYFEAVGPDIHLSTVDDDHEELTIPEEKMPEPAKHMLGCLRSVATASCTRTENPLILNADLHLGAEVLRNTARFGTRDDVITALRRVNDASADILLGDKTYVPTATEAERTQLQQYEDNEAIARATLEYYAEKIGALANLLSENDPSGTA